jgi:hypothetical protein
MEYYSALKKKEVLIGTSKRGMSLEDSRHSEITHLQKNKYCMIPSHELSRTGKSTETENRSGQGPGGGRGVVL